MPMSKLLVADSGLVQRRLMSFTKRSGLMNNDIVTGKLEQIAGKIKESFGEATGDQSAANSGAAEQVKGHARETWGNTKAAVSDVAESKHREAELQEERAKTSAEDIAHDLRSKITSTAENVKNSISEKVDEFKDRHKS
jgi:uncharacterized protein YjbJ (UPF0337 family)